MLWVYFFLIPIVVTVASCVKLISDTFVDCWAKSCDYLKITFSVSVSKTLLLALRDAVFESQLQSGFSIEMQLY